VLTTVPLYGPMYVQCNSTSELKRGNNLMDLMLVRKGGGSGSTKGKVRDSLEGGRD